jgi:hypothetical protein
MKKIRTKTTTTIAIISPYIPKKATSKYQTIKRAKNKIMTIANIPLIVFNKLLGLPSDMIITIFYAEELTKLEQISP